jgi:hypothetical protein
VNDGPWATTSNMAMCPNMINPSALWVKIHTPLFPGRRLATLPLAQSADS